MRIIGRRDELTAVDAFLDDPVRRLLVITGAMGIGKTVVWEAVCAEASARSYQVLVARPVAAEAVLGYAALGDLFGTVADDVLDELPAPQRRALRVALVRAEADEEGADPRSVATAVLGVLRLLAAAGPVLVAIDDAPWLDPATARVLEFALRRLGEAEVRVVVTARTGEGGGLPPLATDSIPEERAMRLTPAPFSLGAVRTLLDERLGVSPTRRLLVRLYETSGGNPFFALELGQALGGRAMVELGEELPSSSSLRRLVRERVTQLPDAVRRMLLVVALTPGAAVHLVVEAVGPSSALEHLDVAVAAGVVEVRDGVVAFAHPLLRAVVVAEALPGERRAAHRKLAAVVPDPIERAGHAARAAAAPDAELAVALVDAAREAYLLGACETAAELAEFAIRATPDVDRDERAARTVVAAQYRFESGDPARAREHIDAVARTLPAGPARARALARQALYQRYCGEPLPVWTAILRQALNESDPDDLWLRAEVHGALAMASLNGGDPATMPEHIAAITEIAARTTDQALIAQSAAGRAHAALIVGDGLRRDLITTALDHFDGLQRMAVEIRPSYTAAVTLLMAGDVAAARTVFDREYAEATDRGDEAGLPILLWQLVLLETLAGQWDRAEQLAEHGQQAAELAGSPVGVAFMASTHAHLLAGQGRVEQARAAIETAQTIGRAASLIQPQYFSHWAAAQLDLSLGDPAAVHARLEPVMAQASDAGLFGLAGHFFLTDEVEALVRLRELAAARQLLDPWRERLGTTSEPLARITQARCLGLLLAAEGDLIGAEQELTAGLTLGTGLGMPLEYGRTLLVAAEVHRRARHRRLAQERYAQARDVFAGLGATLWLRRCETELDRYGPPAAGDTLTATERRVAQLAADGLTTREIAAAVFASPRTVEAHLQHTYQKLGVRSRVALGRRLAELDDQGADYTPD